ncbi:MAG: hypothetical protein CFE43_19715 [Burkholderiales bacterium PBB3]|nr:MAG: hypothetical protein CFE43_19715 [Burkholderiales bacterium PBB3]
MRRQVIVTLGTEEEESQYEQQDWRLHTQIQSVATEALGAGRAEALLTVHDDWYPNKTKSLNCDQAAVSADLVGELQGLLQGEFADWCLAIEVYRRSDGQEHELGPIRVYADKVFAVQALASHLES